MNSDLQSAEQSLSLARHDLGKFTAEAYLNREHRYLGFQMEAVRMQRYIRRREELTATLRAGIEYYMSDTIEDVDRMIKHALKGRTIEARVLAGMQPTNPIDIKSRKRVRPYQGADETVRGTFARVSSMDGTIELHHPIRGVRFGIQVVRMHRGIVRQVVELDIMEKTGHGRVPHPRASSA